MHPQVNTVDSSHSRIRTLEEQVQRLRRELLQKEQAPPPPPPPPAAATSERENVEESGMHERLQAQLAQNKELIKAREALARCGSGGCVRVRAEFFQFAV